MIEKYWVEYYTDKLLNDPSNPELYNLRGCAYLENEEIDITKYECAIKDFSKSIELQNDFELAYINRAEAFKNLKKYKDAINDLQIATKINPENYESFFKIGANYFYLKDYTNSIYALENAIKLKQEYIEAYEYLALCYASMNDFNKAIETYTKLILLEPNHRYWYELRGDVYILNKEYRKAIENYTFIIEENNANLSLQPANEYFYFKRGEAYFQILEFKKSINDFTNVISINPNKALYYYHRGYTYMWHKNFDKTIEDYNKLIDLEPDKEENYILRAFIFSEFKKDYNAAISDYYKAIKLNPENHKNYFDLGEIYFKTKNLGSSIIYYTEAINHIDKTEKAESCILYYNRAICYFLYEIEGGYVKNKGVKINNIYSAVEDLNTCIEIYPQIDIYLERGKIYLYSQDYNLAIDDFKKKIEIDDKCAEAYYLLSKTYTAIGNANLTNFYYSKAIQLDPKYVNQEYNTNNQQINIEKEKIIRYISKEVKNAVWRRAEGKCEICGSQYNLEFDHIIPYSKGGSNTYRNIQLLCEKCNRSKYNKIG